MASPRPRYASYQPPPPPPTPDAPAPKDAPSPGDAPSPSVAPSPRYAYLMGRLQGRQITMEEATELFELQQRTIQSILAQANRPPSPVASPVARPAPRTPSTAHAFPFNDDTIAVGLVALGAGAGLLAALLARSAEGGRRARAQDRNRSG